MQNTSLLSNVVVFNPQHKDLITYDANTGQFKNLPPSLTPGIIHTSAPLTGDGELATPITTVIGAANTFMRSNGAADTFAPLNLGASISGNGVSTPLATVGGSTPIVTDLPITGDGTSGNHTRLTIGAADTILGSNGVTDTFSALNLDTSIVGNGVSTPLTLSIKKDGTLAGNGTVASPLAILAVQHDASLSGGGSGASPLALAVQHNATLTGLGSVASPLGTVLGAANTFFSSDGATDTFAALNVGAGLSGNGKSTPLTTAGGGTAIVVDAPLLGDGTSGNHARMTVGAANTFLGSDGATDTFAALNVGAADLSGNGKSTSLLLNTQANPAAPQGAAAAGVVGLQVSLNTKGVITDFDSLDNSNFGSASRYTTSYIGTFDQTQNIPNNAETTILMNNHSSATFWSSLPTWVNTGTGVFTVPTTGWYRLECLSNFPSAVGTVRILIIRATTSNPAATDVSIGSYQVGSAASLANTGVLVSRTYRFTVGDTFHFLAFQNSGGTMNNCTFTLSVEFISNSSP